MTQVKREVVSQQSMKFPAGRQVPQRPKAEEPPPAPKIGTPRPDPRKPAVRVEEIEQQPVRATPVQPAPQAVARDLNIEKNSNYIDITLPSNFHFYPFKSLAVRTFRAVDQSKCIRAAKEGRFRHLVDAISATLQPGISAYDLTHEDFYFLMYWHRMNSFSKTPYVHRTICENPDHLAKVMTDEMDDKTLEIQTLITNTHLQEVQFDPTKIVVPEGLAEKYKLDVLRIRDMVEIEEMEDQAPDFPDIEFLADLAGYIKPEPLKTNVPNAPVQYQSIKDRIQVVAEMTPDEVEDLQKYVKSVSSYGVTENINVKCRGCGAEREAKVSIDALAFLPTSR